MAINGLVEIRRTLKDDGSKAVRYHHSQVVFVDDHLMYIGSDNIYPAYCKEYGIRVDDAQAIQKWKDKFFKGLWDRSYVDKK